MKWMQFLTPAKSISPKEAREYVAKHSDEDFTLLDVRQDSEYQEAHLPGAVLIPLPQLSDRLEEIDAEKPVLVYCAIGGRSRVAAQMLSGKGFKKVYNMSGGIKAWQGNTAVGPQDLGLHIFNDVEDPCDVLKIAYSLEQGLREFYLRMEKESQRKEVKSLFAKLAEIEIKHQEEILAAYGEYCTEPVDRQTFELEVETHAMEGGLSTEEYLALFDPDLSSEKDVISLAMSIEAQAHDLYMRLGARLENIQAKEAVNKIANDEKKHLESLGRLMDSL